MFYLQVLSGGSVVVAAEHIVEFLCCHEDGARLAALIRTDNSLRFEHIDEPCRPRVAYPEAALEHRYGGLTGIDHDRHRS